ncbi:MAG: hypothetical protein PUK70_03840 [Bacteroidales bacterium]|nr:hypothetical protein [Bacteroidales bacterium]MDY6002695.1 hypothetical protein [Candidatus Cryptobacteroides sp.]
MNKYIGLFLCLAIVISCEHSSQLSSFDYKDLKKAPVLSLEDVFEPIKFIPLKTTESHKQFIMEFAEDSKNLYLSIFDRNWNYSHYVLKKTDGIIYRGDFRLSDSLDTEFSPRWQNEGWLIDVLDPSTINYGYTRDITDDARQRAYSYLSSVGIEGITMESNPIIMLAKAK